MATAGVKHKRVVLTIADEVKIIEMLDAIMMARKNMVVGHAPMQRTIYILLDFHSRGGQIECEVPERRKKGKGLEVPCMYKLLDHGSGQLISKLQKSLKLSLLTVDSSSCPY